MNLKLIKNIFYQFDLNIIILEIALIIFIFFPLLIRAETNIFYKCIDKEGNEILSDYIINGAKCKNIGEFDKMSKEEVENYRKDREEKRNNTYEEIKKADKIAIEKAAKEAAEKAKEERLRKLEEETKRARIAAEEAAEAAREAARRSWEAEQASKRNRRP